MLPGRRSKRFLPVHAAGAERRTRPTQSASSAGVVRVQRSAQLQVADRHVAAGLSPDGPDGVGRSGCTGRTSSAAAPSSSSSSSTTSTSSRPGFLATKQHVRNHGRRQRRDHRRRRHQGATGAGRLLRRSRRRR